MSIEKWAVDSAAKEYWSSYFKEYGKTWVRDIPRKVRKAMTQSTKTANSEGAQGIVSPIGTAVTKEAVFLEGLFTPPSGAVVAFSAKFDHDGHIVGFDSVPLAAKTASKPDFLKSKGKSKSTSKSTSKSRSK
jgi:hypothetical protein